MVGCGDGVAFLAVSCERWGSMRYGVVEGRLYAEDKVPKGGVGASCLCCDTLKLELELLLPSLFVFLWFALELKCPVDLCALLRIARY